LPAFLHLSNGWFLCLCSITNRGQTNRGQTTVFLSMLLCMPHPQDINTGILYFIANFIFADNDAPHFTSFKLKELFTYPWICQQFSWCFGKRPYLSSYVNVPVAMQFHRLYQRLAKGHVRSGLWFQFGSFLSPLAI